MTQEQTIKAFATWLESQGYTVAPEAPEWQAIRYYDLHGKAFGMYTDKRGTLGRKFINVESGLHWADWRATLSQPHLKGST